MPKGGSISAVSKGTYILGREFYKLRWVTERMDKTEDEGTVYIPDLLCRLNEALVLN